MNRINTLLLAGALSASANVWAEDAACATVKLGDPGWSDIAVTNGIASFLLEGLGYQTQSQTLAVPIIYAGLQKGQLDVFLGNWMPAQQSNYDKFVASGEVDQLAQNLDGTEYTLAVPTYAYEAGVKTFADLDKHADKFGKKLYGIASGSPANESIKQMIAADEFGLGDWQLVESSEQAMLVQVGRAVKREQFVVFLGWTPHPMNVQYDMKYLRGGEKYFGDSGQVNTLARKGYAQQCPNAGKLLSNLKFTQEMENSIMDRVLSKQASNAQAIKDWLQANPQVLDAWLDGVTTRDGGDGLAAVKARL
ncbi:choline ABC transporter substrate-binding protein [Pseudomonas sp. KHPS1]|jgi:glycine betaine/proline transport system substrate-binding protein|nr:MULTISPECIES: choline ABC transporter substrate-binding protein [unclassified Pseudomonas]ARS47017.1 glycine/betaine ABC transporter substrate-binding protein [Pseudomonas mendocina]ATH79730.1 glycine/betaine ABC transporter substrate-binding protein [Pseudomonas mendocina]MBA4245710.1 choline ABC transporter substrate-binding protein [Pseudomonas sp.]UTH36705.1 choline ABC transporter substrate-binding protein [Pseudomonas sp. KHPS1]